MDSRWVLLLLIVSFFLLTTATVSAADWGQYRHDGANTAGYEDANITGSWAYDVRLSIASSVVVSEDTAYFFDTDGNLHAFNISKAGWEWIHESNSQQKSPILYGDRVFVESEDTLTALNRSGEVVWETESDTFRNYSPTVNNGTVYINNGITLRALDYQTGETEWVTRMNAKEFGFITAGDGVYATGGIENASERIERSVQEGVYDDYWGERIVPERIDYSEYVSMDEINLHRLDRSIRTEWVFSDGLPITSPTVSDNRVFFAGLNYSLYAVNSETGEKDWKAETENVPRNSPVYSNGTVYIGTSKGVLHAFDSESGEEEWVQDTEFGSFVNIAVSGDGSTVYTTSGRGDNRIYAFDSESGEGRLEAALDEDDIITSPPTVVGSSVIVASGTEFYSISDGEVESPIVVIEPSVEDELDDDTTGDAPDVTNGDTTDVTGTDRSGNGGSTDEGGGEDRTGDETGESERSVNIDEELPNRSTSIVMPLVIGFALMSLIAVAGLYRRKRQK